MSMFKLPSGFCEQLKQYCGKFSWGSELDTRKIHWMAWMGLCEKKNQGSLGFKYLDAHNLALLAKQAWRLTTYQNSLIARIFKNNYYIISSFRKAQLGSNPSAIWKEILDAREVLLDDGRLRVGNGVEIEVFKDRSLPTSSAENHNPFISVSSLICASGSEWNRVVISELFSPEQARSIYATPLVNSSRQDRFIWCHIVVGCYSVKSGYYIAKDIMHRRKHFSAQNQYELIARDNNGLVLKVEAGKIDEVENTFHAQVIAALEALNFTRQ
ncbi:uncharacterized protein [Rutidosis leptorrhynchoides]|uniref:uncharacterized protein n=1 Tax=Rutidosis leptorrhynchoides TaxID=125765 RepID=UPI003A98ED7B